MTAEGAAGARETVLHAIRLWAKAELLRAQARESIAVAAALQHHLDDDEYDELVLAVREADISPRIGFTQARPHPALRFQCEPGDVIERDRGDASPWPRRHVHLVYILIDQDSEVIYIGKSHHVRARIAGHKAKPWVRCQLIICDSEDASLALEGDLIYQHQPPLNIADRHRRRTA